MQMSSFTTASGPPIVGKSMFFLPLILKQARENWSGLKVTVNYETKRQNYAPRENWTDLEVPVNHEMKHQDYAPHDAWKSP